MDLSPTQCPYDGALLDAELSATGRLQLVCCACDAVWETHGSHVARIGEPDREKLIAARQGSQGFGKSREQHATDEESPASR